MGEVVTMKFCEYLAEVNKEEDKVFEARVGCILMPVVYASKADMNLDNPYLRKKYGALLDSEVAILKPNEPDSYELEICQFDGPVMDLAVTFFWAAAGHTSTEEYSKLFTNNVVDSYTPYARVYGGEPYGVVDVTTEFVRRFGEFFSGLEKVELSFDYYAETSEWGSIAKRLVDKCIKGKKISFDGADLFLTFSNGRQLKLSSSEWGSIARVL